MVGSVDHEGIRYACPLPLNQSNREESIIGVRSMVTELVNLYKKNTNTFPARVLYFRDGVAEGQFAKVKNIEVTAIKEAVAALSGTTPTVTAIVVRKRIHTRFFPRDGEGDRSSRGNVHPGTVVDGEITHPCDFDFCTTHIRIFTYSRFGTPFLYSRNSSSGALLYFILYHYIHCRCHS
jgi:eukaryotic translation initiation factor 2C